MLQRHAKRGWHNRPVAWQRHQRAQNSPRIGDKIRRLRANKTLHQRRLQTEPRHIRAFLRGRPCRRHKPNGNLPPRSVENATGSPENRPIQGNSGRGPENLHRRGFDELLSWLHSKYLGYYTVRRYRFGCVRDTEEEVSEDAHDRGTAGFLDVAGVWQRIEYAGTDVLLSVGFS